MNFEKSQEISESGELVSNAEQLSSVEEEMQVQARTIENPVKRKLITTFLALVGAITAGGCGNLKQELDRLPGNLEGALIQMNQDAQRDAEYRRRSNVEQPTQAQVKLELNNTKLKYSEQWSNKPAPSKKHKK